MVSQSNRVLQYSRRVAPEVAPAYEDAGLFKTALGEMMLELIPQMRKNDRQDLIVRGFADRKIEIDVVFAGRRVGDVTPLVDQLKILMSEARKQAALAGKQPPDVRNIRLPVRIEGAWRQSFKQDPGGWQTGTYVFMAARWSILDHNGKTITFGESPMVVTPPARTGDSPFT